MANRVPEYYRNANTMFPRSGPRERVNITSVDQQGKIIAAAESALAEIGQEYYLHEKRLAKDQALEETSLNIDRNLSDLYQKNQTNSEKFEEDSRKEKAKWLQEIPEDLQKEYEIMFDRRQLQFSQRIKATENNIAKERQTATFLNAAQKYSEQAMIAARSGDEASLQENINAYMKMREDLLSNGALSAERYINMGEAFTDEVEAQKYLGEYDAIKSQGQPKVYEFINNFMARTDIPDSKKKRYANKILADYHTYMTTHTLQIKDLQEKTLFVANAVSQGLTPQIDTVQLLTELENNGQYEQANKLRKTIELGKEAQEFVKLDPLAMKNGLEALEQNLQTPYDYDRLQILQKTYATTLREINNDPMNFAISRGIVDDSPSLNISDTDQVQKRIINAKMLRQRYRLAETPYLTKSEADSLSAEIKNNDSRNNAQLLAMLNNSFGNDSSAVIRQIAPAVPQFSQAAALYKDNPDAAIGIIEGIDVIKHQPEYTPSSNDDFYSAYYNIVDDNMFADISPKWNENIRETVKARLAALNKARGKTDRLVDPDTLRQAVTDVVGEIATLDMDGSGWLWDSSFKVPVPQGKTAEDLENWYMNLTDKDVDEAVTLSGHKISIDDLHGFGVLSYAGDRQYRVRINGELLYTADGKPFILTYKDED